MLCVAKVTLSDWPLDSFRDVDPADETIRGLLRSGYIVPAVVRKAAPVQSPSPAVEVAEATVEEAPAPRSAAKPRRSSAKKE